MIDEHGVLDVVELEVMNMDYNWINIFYNPDQVIVLLCFPGVGHITIHIQTEAKSSCGA